ncbi:Phosphatidylserine decarboxylase proenzyme [Gracilariopsis chorda]|uniref:Phosphatidylserine decarboxylase proenzyme n=1 Tax=Gracilariopsis chorda TaxID=448386 RepID=A0A2V3IZC1_9FLOR|nr:Phosphatidylserine decarboxylase proenzyme [Gracilariopsis chorda]|eukprot:PXF46480.1 Phosphatidylserine decarboxylase proenzyme [Gracilariopsis chorda]
MEDAPETITLPPYLNLPKANSLLLLKSHVYTTPIVKKLLKKLDENPDTEVHPAVLAFQQLIETDAALYQDAVDMFRQVPLKYASNPEAGFRPTSYEHMSKLINAIIRSPPMFEESIFAGCPLASLLDACCGTAAGVNFFRNPKVNSALKDILSAWGAYLSSAESLLAFEAEPMGGGWSSPRALAMIDMSQYVQPDADALGWGYASWNDWFCRKFKEGKRPVAAEDDDSIITNACESTPVSLQTNVQMKSRFWLKRQPYSLSFMLNDDELAKEFEDGTVYQAYLDSCDYHRWHAPVSGTIKKTVLVPGTYFSEGLWDCGEEEGADFWQGYVSHVATRALIFMEAKNKNIGFVAVVAVGMGEVSSTVVTVKQGQTVRKGDELGHFQFGGSTHCVVFQKEVIADWNAAAVPGASAKRLPLHSWLARARCGGEGSVPVA